MKKISNYAEYFIHALIFYSLGMYFVEIEFAHSENSLAGHPFFLWSERFVAGVFTIEYFIRWRFAKNKLKYPITPMAIVDLLAVIPFYVGFLVSAQSLRLVRTFRLLRLFKLYKYNEALQSFVRSFRLVKRQLSIVGIAVFFFIFLSSNLIYECERNVQPEMFGRYSDAIWWSFVTLTTVGYGDTYPITDIGRTIAVITILFGLGIFGTFVSLIGSAFVKTLEDEEKEERNNEKALLIAVREANMSFRDALVNAGSKEEMIKICQEGFYESNKTLNDFGKLKVPVNV